MARIQITESELRKIIAESVSAQIREMNEDWQSRQTRRAGAHADRYNNTLNKINKINQTGNPADRETNQYNRLQRRLGRQTMKNGAMFQQQATDNAEQLATVRKNLNSVCEALGINNGDANAAIQAAQQLVQSNEALQNQVTDLTTKLKAAQGSITKQQATIKDLNAQIAQTKQAQQPAQQQQPLNPQTDGAKAAAYGNNTQLASR